MIDEMDGKSLGSPVSRETSGCPCQDRREEMRRLRRSSASGRRQTGQTARLSRSSLAGSKQAAAVNGSQQGSWARSRFAVEAEQRREPAWHHRAPVPAVWQLGWGQHLHLRASLPTCKTCPPTPSSLGKVSLGAELQTLERGCPGKSRILGLILVSGGWAVFFTHFPGSATGQCSNGKCSLPLSDLLWSEGILLDRGLGYHPVGLSSSNIEGLKGHTLKIVSWMKDKSNLALDCSLYKEETILGPLASVTLVTDFTSSLLYDVF